AIGPVGAGGAALIVAASYAGQAIERRHRARIGAAVGAVGQDGGMPSRAPADRSLDPAA
ncbi:EamA family transporter, partial [Clavibacter phaseoli]